MNIVILDTNTLGDDIDLSIFDKLGNVTVYQSSTSEEAALRLMDADVAVVNKVLINSDTLKYASHIKLVALTATGYNNVDLDYTKSRDITVCNVASYSTDSVVQHTFALLFYVLEKLNYYDNYVKSGDYVNSNSFSHFDRRFMELAGKTWGIIGLGEIGRGVAKIATAFGCNVIYYSTSGRNNNSDYTSVEFDELLRKSDIISVHCALTDKTKKMMDYKAFSKMKNNAIFLNLGRGPIVDDEGLCRALEEGLIDGAGLDVVTKEPIEAENPLMRFKDSSRLIITPHIAWATLEARTRLIETVCDNIRLYQAGTPQNVVTK